MAETPPNSIHPLTRAEWRAWLQENYARKEGIWVIWYKKASGKARLGYEEMVEEALCFGWIDGVINKLDAERTMQWLAPRKPRSGWSRSNKERVERLVAAGLMTPAGMEKIEAARRDGSWTALDAVQALEIPDDLAQALSENEPARAFFEGLAKSAKRGILYWIASAKREETRARRIAETVRAAAEGRRVVG